MCLTAKPTVEWTCRRPGGAGGDGGGSGDGAHAGVLLEAGFRTVVRFDASNVARKRTAVQLATMSVRAHCPPHPRRRSAPRARRRRRATAAARALRRGGGCSPSAGPRNVSMDAVAAAAGVGKGTLFRRFGDRAGLARAVLAEHEAQLQDALIRGAAAARPGRAAASSACSPSAAPTWTSSSATLDLLLAAEYGARRASGWPARVYAFYRTHVTLLLREAGCGDARRLPRRRRCWRPLAAPLFGYQRELRAAVARRARSTPTRTSSPAS